MAKQRPNHKDNPFKENRLLHEMVDELNAFLLFARHQWYYIVLVVIAIGFGIYYLRPLPPSEIRIARGQANSTIELEAQNFKRVLKEHGIEAELIDSKGTLDSLKELEDGIVDVALTQSGLPIKPNLDIVSLGSVGYQAFWFFYTGPEVQSDDVFKSFENKRIYINRVGSGTNFMVQTLLALSPKIRSTSVRLVDNLSPKEAVDALTNHQIDGMFLLAGYDSKNVQALLANPQVHILNFPVANALAYKIRGVDAVTLPKGIYSISPPRPSQDIKMIAASTTLLVKKDLHPEIQYLLLQASKASYEANDVAFDRPGGFPAFIEKGVPHSEIADKYYEKGPPSLANRVPFWLASFLEYAWITLIALAAIIYPIMQFRPNYRAYIYEMYSDRLYNEIFAVSNKIEDATKLVQIQACFKEIDILNKKVYEVWVPMGMKDTHANMLNAMAVLSSQAKNKEQLIQQGKL